jgi:hypothetical protein
LESNGGEPVTGENEARIVNLSGDRNSPQNQRLGEILRHCDIALEHRSGDPALIPDPALQAQPRRGHLGHSSSLIVKKCKSPHCEIILEVSFLAPSSHGGQIGESFARI